MSRKVYVIAMDGPAGAGKSTIAKLVAKRLGFSFLDTGAMYRALTYKAMQTGVNLENEDALFEMAKQTSLVLEQGENGVKVSIDGKDISQEIRTLPVTNNTFYVARAPKLREILVEWQRQIAGEQSVVAEGRDVTTVVFPNASHKFYLDATVEERAMRRYKELKEKGQTVDFEQLKKEIEEGGQKDFTRKVGPLKRIESAVYIDTSHMSIEEVVAEMRKHIGL